MAVYVPPSGHGGGSNVLDIYNAFPRSGPASVSNAPAPVNPRAQAPQASVGTPVPYVLGRSMIGSPNVIWIGNLDPIYESKSESTQETETYWTDQLSLDNPYNYEVTTTKVVTTTYIVGYYMDIHMGLCLGPDVKLIGIFYNNEKIWSGSIGPDRASITLDDGDFPISGATVIFHGGAFDQTIDSTVTDDDMSAYPGIAYVILQNIRADKPLQSLQFEVERFPNKLMLSSGDNAYNNDINVISAIADVITNGWGGAGVDISNINTVNFKAKAEILADEENSVSLTSYGDGVKRLISNLMQQIHGILYQNPETGKLEISLIRKDSLVFSADTNFSTNDIIAFRNFDKAGWSNTLDKLSGSYTNRANNYKPDSVFVQNVNSITNDKISDVDYPYVTNSDLMIDLLSRDLGLMSAPLFSLSIDAKRKAASLLPGQVIIVSWADYSLYGVPILVSKVRKLPMNNNTVVIEGKQYLTPQISPVFEVPGTAFDPGISLEPVKPERVKFITAPYWIARSAGVVSSGNSDKLIAPVVLPVPANEIQSSFDVYSKYKSATVGGVKLYNKYIDKSAYPSYGQLNTAIDKYDGWTTGLIDEIIIDGVINTSNLREIGDAGIHAGDLFLIIGNEILSFKTVAETGTDQYTLYDCRRALLDTVAESHTADVDVFIVNNNYRNVTNVSFSYPLDSTPEWLVASNVTNQDGSTKDSDHYLLSSGWTPSTARTIAPVRPHDTKIEGTRNSTKVDIFLGSDVDVSWKTRNRKSASVKFQTDTAEDSELLSSGERQYHTVAVLDAGNTEIEIDDTNKDNNYNTITVTMPTSGVALGDGWLFVKAKLEFESGTVESVFDDMLPVQILPNGTILSEDENSYLISEDGLSIIIQEEA